VNIASSPMTARQPTPDDTTTVVPATPQRNGEAGLSFGAAPLLGGKKRGGWKLPPRTPKQCAAISARQKAKWASGTRKPTPRAAYEKASKTKLEGFKNGTHGKMSKEARVVVGRLGGLAVSNDPAKRANAASHLRDLAAKHRGQKNPPGLSEAGENNWKAKWWHIRTPTGENISGKNLNEIIRRHAALFEPEDIIWKKHQCRASKGIGSLGHADGSACSWKGWTLIASVENGDLIARNVALPPNHRI